MDEMTSNRIFGVILTPSPALTILSPARANPFPLNKLPNKLVPNVRSNILKNPPLCPLVSFSIVLVLLLIKY